MADSLWTETITSWIESISVEIVRVDVDERFLSKIWQSLPDMDRDKSLLIWVDLREKKSGRERNLADLPILLVVLAPTG